MGYDQWNHSKFVAHKVRNGSRRGYLQKTYYDKKMMQSRLSTGEKNVNDRMDIIQPAGFLGRHPPGEKCEILTNDIGGDTSRRVSSVIGDREHHPKIDEAESILYSPSDKKNYMRIKGEKPKQEGQGKHGSGAEFEDPYDGEGEETDKNPKGIHAASETNETHTVKETFQAHTEKDVRVKTQKIHMKPEKGLHVDGIVYAKAYRNNPEKYPGGVQTTRDAPPPEEPSADVPGTAGFFFDDDGGVTFTGKVTFQGPVRFDSDVRFDGIIEFAHGEDWDKGHD